MFRDILLSMAFFALVRLAVCSLPNNNAFGELADVKDLPFLEFENPRFENTSTVEKNAVFDVPSFVMGLYRSYAKHDGTAKRNSQRIPVTVHCVMGQVTPRSNGIFFNLNVSDIQPDDSIISAKIRVMINTTGHPHPHVRSSEKLILYDRLNQRPLQAITVKGGGATVVVFPVLDLVMRWIHSPRLNRGVFIRLHSDFLNVKVLMSSTGEATENRPMLTLVVKAQSKPQKVDALSFWTSQGKKENLKPQTRHSRAIRDQGPCSRRSMVVEFRTDIHYKGVVAPKSFQAYRCGGDCKFPLDVKVNPTNRAIVQAILYSTGKDQGTGAPCCVPIKLGGMSTIEYHNNTFSMKFNKDMVVKECGCR